MQALREQEILVGDRDRLHLVLDGGEIVAERLVEVRGELGGAEDVLELAVEDLVGSRRREDHRDLVLLGRGGHREIEAAAPWAEQQVDLVARDQALVVADRGVGVAGVVIVDQLDRHLAALDGNPAGLVGLLGPELVRPMGVGRVGAELAGQRDAVAERDFLLVLSRRGTHQRGLTDQARKPSQQQPPCNPRHDLLPCARFGMSLPENSVSLKGTPLRQATYSARGIVLGQDRRKLSSSLRDEALVRTRGFLPSLISFSLMHTTVSHVMSKALPSGSSSWCFMLL